MNAIQTVSRKKVTGKSITGIKRPWFLKILIGHTVGLCFMLAALHVVSQVPPGPPFIIQQPQDQTVDHGSKVTLSVTAQSDLEMTFQWQKETHDQGWVYIGGATNAELTISSANSSHAAYYRVIVRNNTGNTISQKAALRLTGSPVFLRALETQSVSLVPEVVFSAFVTGSSPINYQWYWKGELLEGATGENLPFTLQPLSQFEVEIDIADVVSEVVQLNEQLVGQAGSLELQVYNDLGDAFSEEVNLEIDATFTKEMEDPILNIFNFRGAWGDYEGDGDQDLFAAHGGVSSLYQNDGEGHFSPIPIHESGLPSSTLGLIGVTGPPGEDEGIGGSWADLDNDGDLDLLFLYGGENEIYLNKGDGTFEKIEPSGIEEISNLSFAGCWSDYDNDGFLDLFISQGTYGSAYRNHLFRNQGNGTFSEEKLGAIVNIESASMAAAWVDYDDDGDPDLFVGNRIGGNSNDFLYRNNGDGTFSTTLTPYVTTVSGDAVSGAWADYDNDGDLDLHVAGGAGRLCINLGNGIFTTDPNFVLSDYPAAGTAAWGDYDNDGDLDLFMPLWANNQNVLFQNDGSGSLTQVFSGSPSNDRGFSMVASWIDIDNDGSLDLYVSNGPTEAYLYHNNLDGNHWLRIRCRGTVSNRYGVGASIRAKARIDGSDVWQMRHITQGDGFQDQRTLDAHLGFGDATSIDLLRIEWPSGIVQELTDVSADQVLEIIEPESPVRIEMTKHDVPLGEAITLNAVTHISAPLSFQWQKDRVDLPGETDAMLQIESVTNEDYGRYTVLVESTGSNGRVGFVTGLSAPESPTILWQPVSQQQALGGVVVFEVQATGSKPLEYQWQHKSEGSADWSDILDADESVLILQKVEESDPGEYQVIVNNAYGTEVSDSVQLSLVPTCEFIDLSVADGKLHFRMQGPSGSTVQVQRSTNLSDWEDVDSVTLGDPDAEVILDIQEPYCFFRAQIVGDDSP